MLVLGIQKSRPMWGRSGGKKANGRERKEMIVYKSFLYLKMYASCGVYVFVYVI